MAPPSSPSPAGRTGPGEAESVAAFQALLTGPGHALLEGLRGHDPAADLALVTRLRRDHPAALVSAALTQARLRQRAAAKFGADAERMFFTPDGLEQATRASVADWRAARFALLGVRRIADLGCGIGGDAIALARAGLTVLAVDRSPLTCAVARANAEALGLADRIDVVRADVTEAAPEAAAYCDAAFLDPARRTGGSRVFDPESYAPPLSWAVAVARRMEHAALKVAPGIPHEAVPEDAEGEWVSDAGDVKEAVLWFGAGTAAGRYRATLLPGGHSRTGGTRPGPPPRTGPPGRYLYEPDGAVIRARLIPELAAELDAPPLDPDIAYLSGDTLHRTPYATAYEITDVLPFGLKRLRALVRERAIGTLTIKKRGFAMTPEQVRGRLRLSGPETATLLLTRIAGAPTMLLGHPVPPPPGP